MGLVLNEHARQLAGVGAVVGAPGRVVVQQDVVGQAAEARGPRRPVAAVVADDQVRCQAGSHCPNKPCRRGTRG